MTDLQVLKFNARAQSEGFNNIQFAWSIGLGWHLQTCLTYGPCICTDLLDDPGRIFDHLPSNVFIEKDVKYFMTLAAKHNKYYVMHDNGHLFNCIYAPNGQQFRGDELYECACYMVRKNPEQFFNIPLQNRFQLPMSSDVKN